LSKDVDKCKPLPDGARQAARKKQPLETTATAAAAGQGRLLKTNT
jgi:hypothetical protein